MTEANMKLLQRVGICSLTEHSDNILMWSHYASSHTGLCLGFEPSLEAIDFACAFEVIYRQDRPTINLIRKGQGEELLEKILLTKAADWSYEREWRMINQDIESRLRHFPPVALKEVILGSRITDHAKAEIIAATKASSSKPAIFQAIPSRSTFSLTIRKLS
ncbi:DUF2971 domain-containing protein [Sphingomonas changbaiensis]|nr:DUF2971 domain-containing protein [Sphingomonas changbaiensis]